MNRIEPVIQEEPFTQVNKRYYKPTTPGLEALKGWTACFVAFLVGVAISVGIGIWLN